MDPISAIGAVASVLQLAGTALSLSKTLYEVSSALSSVKEDICSLAQDLALFSESLTLLSRMLEANKESYGEGIYVLTAKIIMDCGTICGKIEKVVKKLQKRGGLGGKLKWMVSEKKIRSLLERLRDMKITLLMILSNLQLDRQLSLMNISSRSTIECPPQNTQKFTDNITSSASSNLWVKPELPVPVNSGILTTSTLQESPQPTSVDRDILASSLGSNSHERGLRPRESVESFMTAFSVQLPEDPEVITSATRARSSFHDQEIDRTAVQDVNSHVSHHNRHSTQLPPFHNPNRNSIGRYDGDDSGISVFEDMANIYLPNDQSFGRSSGEPRFRNSGEYDISATNITESMEGQNEEHWNHLAVLHHRDTLQAQASIMNPQPPQASYARADARMDQRYILQSPGIPRSTSDIRIPAIINGPNNSLNFNGLNEDYESGMIKLQVPQAGVINPQLTQPSDTRSDTRNMEWRNEMARTVSNHFSLSDMDAEAWASKLPEPDVSQSDNYRMRPANLPQHLQATTDINKNTHLSRPVPRTLMPPVNPLQHLQLQPQPPDRESEQHWAVGQGTEQLIQNQQYQQQQMLRQQQQMAMQGQYSQMPVMQLHGMGPVMNPAQGAALEQRIPMRPMNLPQHLQAQQQQVIDMGIYPEAATAQQQHHLMLQHAQNSNEGQQRQQEQQLLTGSMTSSELPSPLPMAWGIQSYISPRSATRFDSRTTNPLAAHQQQHTLNASWVKNFGSKGKPSQQGPRSTVQNQARNEVVHMQQQLSPQGQQGSMSEIQQQQSPAMPTLNTPLRPYAFKSTHIEYSLDNGGPSRKSENYNHNWSHRRAAISSTEDVRGLKRPSSEEVIILPTKKPRLSRQNHRQQRPSSTDINRDHSSESVDMRQHYISHEVFEDFDSFSDEDISQEYSSETNASTCGKNHLEFPEPEIESKSSPLNCQVWWRAYTIWTEEYPVGTRNTHLPSVLKASKLWPPKDETSPEEWNRYITEYCTDHYMLTDSHGYLTQVRVILKTVSGSIGFATGNIAWAGLAVITNMIYNYGRGGLPSEENKLVELELATVTSIVSRYTVMENIYHGWTGMSLKAEFEAELVKLCVHVLDYLDAACNVVTKGARSSVGGIEMRSKFSELLDLDKKCRGFNVLVDIEGIKGDAKDIEEISSDEDSDEDFISPIPVITGTVQVVC